MTSLRRTVSTQDLMATQQASSVNETNVFSCKSRRTRQCAGCHEPHEQNFWGQPDPHCQGQDDDEDQVSFTMFDADNASKQVQFVAFDQLLTPATSIRESNVLPNVAEKRALEEEL
eukprot:gene8468-14458_t